MEDENKRNWGPGKLLMQKKTREARKPTGSAGDHNHCGSQDGEEQRAEH